jgi:enoyl-CoA hydratase
VFVRADVRGRRGRIRLDRGKALNALDLGMIRAIRRALDSFATDPDVEFVTIESERPGVFCAGGDIRAVREASLAGRHDENEAFFAEEFALNHRIASFPKPYVALIDGVCMGGGMGLSVHGSHRVVTDRTVMAMPETAIGYFPDIGASYFLNRLAGALGTYLALTGARIGAADAMDAGLATAFVPADRFNALCVRLDTAGAEDLDRAIAELAPVPASAAPLRDQHPAIDRCFGAGTVDELFQSLAAEGGPWAEETTATLRSMSPTSLAVSLALLRRTRGLPLAACLEIELRLTRTMTRGHDFLEGVRALLVDKDRQPRWAPLDPSMVQNVGDS